MECTLPSNSSVIINQYHHLYHTCVCDHIYNHKVKAKIQNQYLIFVMIIFWFSIVAESNSIWMSESHANTLFINAHSKVIWPVYIGYMYLTQKQLKHTLLVFCVIVHLVVGKMVTVYMSLPVPATRNCKH